MIGVYRAKKVQIKINQTRARRVGVSSKDIASSLQTGFSGLELTQYREGNELIPVTLRSVAADRDDIGKLESDDGVFTSYRRLRTIKTSRGY